MFELTFSNEYNEVSLIYNDDEKDKKDNGYIINTNKKNN